MSTESREKPLHYVESKLKNSGIISRQAITKRKRSLIFIGACVWAVTSCSPTQEVLQKPNKPEIQKIEQTIARLESGSDGIQYSVWLGQPNGEIWFAYNSNTIRPAASAIKTAILIEFFDERIDSLDAPVPDLDTILDNPKSSAIGHFTPEQKAAARTELRGLTARQLAEAMIHKEHIQTNAAYNGATNVAIEYLGGPQALTDRIRRRFPNSDGLQIARYMLADRQKNGDNLLTANSLAAVLGFLAQTPVNDRLRTEARTVLFLESDEFRGDHYYKGGTLTSPPQVRIQAGWWEKDRAVSVYVVIATHPVTASGSINFDDLRSKLSELSKVVQDVGTHIRDSTLRGQ